MVGSRFVKAVGLANEWHMGQVRKGTEIPYISHLLAVASLVLEDEGDEDMAIAALLHDAIEDAGVLQDRIEQEFGECVAGIVAECSDGEPGQKRDESTWRERKERYIQKLRTLDDPDALKVSCADKLHNARSIQRDLNVIGEEVWERFNRPVTDQRWYYEELVDAFASKIPDSWLSTELARTVAEIFPAERQDAG